ncbi:hypothetical protein [Conexibacter arvalis]|uniref:Uncharacterized protein n=1 Tax=Conexibacter arvalis TaxID=912552 RepID=A0A840IFT7_9ACTN|nr:hypothetical protein [Conexibacter arvalis]MBB4663101.1 hypothetical protein [Conexibacter arvalis]
MRGSWGLGNTKRLEVRARRRRLDRLGAQRITDDVVREVARDLRERYAFDDDVRLRGAKLADDPRVARHAENRAFAECVIGEHRETFDRLAK